MAAIKAAKENDFEVDAFESSDGIGGLWRYDDNRHGVAAFTHINVSKHNYCFSDFPFDSSTPDYPHHSQMLQYLQAYALKFRLLPHIMFNTTVQSVALAGDGGVVVTTTNAQRGCLTSHYDHIMIASGHHVTPITPQFPGLSSFEGQALHSISYKKPQGFEGKRVVVVGIGNSGVDIATSLVGTAAAVDLSSRSGAWVVPNYLFGTPTDHYVSRLALALPLSLTAPLFERMVSIQCGSPFKWGFNPKMRITQSQPTVSATLVHHVARGSIVLRPNIKSISKRSVEFDDGRSASADIIVFATGYKISFPFLSPDVARQVVPDPAANEISLYHNVFHPSIGAPIAFVGLVQPSSGGLLPMAEMQCRWACEIFARRVSLPPPSSMIARMRADAAAVRRRFYGSARHSVQRDTFPYNDALAAEIGCKPPLLSLDVRLMCKLWLGTATPSQWRLRGPHAWIGAAEVVQRAPITWLGKICGVAVAITVMMVLLLPFVYVCMFP